MTQALNAAIQAACNTDPMYPTPCTYPDCYCNIWPKGTLAALRAALPAEPPSALMSAIHMAIEHETGSQINMPISQIIWRMARVHLLGGMRHGHNK